MKRGKEESDQRYVDYLSTTWRYTNKQTQREGKTTPKSIRVAHLPPMLSLDSAL